MPPRRSLAPQRRRLLIPLLLAVIAACGPIEEIRERFAPPETAHQAYRQSLEAAGLDSTALGRDWITAAERSLRDAPLVVSPFREVGFLAVEEAAAVALRVSAQRGQRVTFDVALDTDPGAIVFLDAFRAAADTVSAPARIASADREERSLSFEVRRTGDYILRIQPELLRGGRYTLSIVVGPALAFPVERAGNADIGSVFGDPRDAGRRAHHGIDIFAARGRPVLSASHGVVTRARETPVGGKVVWVRDEARGMSLYYAHLDAHNVDAGARVEPGDTIGFVGNTGNARTTPPHLHFGIYSRGEGPIDPQPFVSIQRITPPTLAVDTTAVGRLARASSDGLRLRASPEEQAIALTELPRHTVVRVLSAAGGWYRVRLPDDTHGFVAGRLLEPVDEPIRETSVTTPLARARPSPDAHVIDELGPGTPVPVLGRFGDYLLVTVNGGRSAWLPAD